MLEIAFLIPIKTTSLYNSSIYKLLKFFKDQVINNHIFNFYLGFDNGDKCLNEISLLQEFHSSNFTITIIEYKNNIQKGHLTKMWNILMKKSYNKNDYFYQLGDDIIFHDYNFIDTYIKTLKISNNIGVTGLLQGTKQSILTQSFVSKKHYQIFKYLFPNEILNWYCDNWISKVYSYKNLYFPISTSFIENNSISTGIRYIPNRDKDIYKNELIKGKEKLNEYLNYTYSSNTVTK